MPINYTTLLGLAKPVTGTEANAWGDVVNDQVTSLVEDAIANAVSISVSAGNVTLSDNDGATDQARMAALLITGSPGTTRNIVAPSRSKWYIVRNGSDSSVVVKGSATTGVTIASGKTAMVFWNGSDFQTVASNNVNLTTEVTGTLPVANGGTGTTTSTGSGSVVLSTSPTLVTPILGAASATSVALAAGAVGTPSLTATGDLNTGMWFPATDTLAWSTGGSERMRVDTSGNLGLGTTSPGSFDSAWQRLVIGGGSGDIGQTIYSGSASIGTMAFADGTSGAQQYAGLIRYLHASDAMTFWANADERMRINSSGNVGIGTNTPSSKLHVSSGATDEVARFEGTGQPYISLYDSGVREFFIQATGGGINVYGETNKPMLFYTNSVARTQIAADGAQSSVIPGGSTLYPQFACRAWINFDGTSGSIGTGRGSGNVSSVTDNGTGDYTINFSTAMPDANYAVTGVAMASSFSAEYIVTTPGTFSWLSSSIRVGVRGGGGSATDVQYVCVAVFR